MLRAKIRTPYDNDLSVKNIRKLIKEMERAQEAVAHQLWWYVTDAVNKMLLITPVLPKGSVGLFPLPVRIGQMQTVSYHRVYFR